MTTQTLSRITLETMANSRTVATQMVAAYGAGSRRLVQAVDGALQTRVLPRAAKLAPQAGQRLDALRDSVNSTVIKGIDRAVAQSEQLIVRSNGFAVTQVDRWADRVAGLDNALLASGLQTAARLTLPAAQLVLVVSGKAAEGATQLATAAGAHPVRRAVRKAATSGRRSTAKGVKSAQTLATKAKGATKATTKATTKAKAQIGTKIQAVRRRAAKAPVAVAPVAAAKRARKAVKPAAKATGKTASV
jgi:hypothetical protein